MPIDENRSTTVQWHIGAKNDQIEVKFDFGDGAVNSFFDFIQSDQFSEARSIGQSIIMQAEQFLIEKNRSPLRAILGAYVLLRANAIDGMNLWTKNLVTYCDWLPDALAVRVEYLARNGEHFDALQLLLQTSRWGTPWFRSGVAYLEKRASIYSAIAADKRADFSLKDEDVKKLERIATVFSELATGLDMAHPTSVCRGIASA